MNLFQEKTMNEDQVKGRINEMKGRVKEAIGIVAGDKKMENKGKVKSLKGKVQAGFGDAKEKIKKAI
jgi:uncharacterized protein YjbJ (UPF0337 family)